MVKEAHEPGASGADGKAVAEREVVVFEKQPDWLVPQWHLPSVGAVMTTRSGGVSQGAWRSMNLGAACGDDPADVVANRAMLHSVLGGRPTFLQQVHGVNVVELGTEAPDPLTSESPADACVTTRAGVACTVLAADCLPVLFAASNGRAVGAAHAGWRGLAAGVVEATLARVCALAQCDAADVHAWLGACIGPDNFEVGVDVLQAFGAASSRPGLRFRPGLPGKWLADLPGLATDRLQAAGVLHVSGGVWCTVNDADRFFSYRRDKVCGRMAACIWLRA